MTSSFKILIYEPEYELGVKIRDHLMQSDIRGTLFSSIEELYKEDITEEYLLGIISLSEDISLGLEIAEGIKRKNENISLVFLNRDPEREGLVSAFKAGADDYIRIPFDLGELTCRIMAILRRKKPKTESPKGITGYYIGNLLFDIHKQILAIGESVTKLTTKESELLSLLCQHANDLVEREHVLQLIWQNDSYFSARSMDVYITKLRKLLRAEPTVSIVNIHGKGYKLVINKTVS